MAVDGADVDRAQPAGKDHAGSLFEFEWNLQGARQIGFARLITDRATFAYLADVFVLPEFRGQGLSKWLIGCVCEHPELQGLRRWMLATRDANGLYERSGLTPLKNPGYFMEKHDPDVYLRKG